MNYKLMAKLHVHINNVSISDGINILHSTISKHNDVNRPVKAIEFLFLSSSVMANAGSIAVISGALPSLKEKLKYVIQT